MPGNRPGLWLPDAWECVGSDKDKIAQARREQAYQLDKFIRINAKAAEVNAKRMNISFSIATFAVFAAGVCLVTYLAIAP
jgi:hypothetical protein